MSLSLPKSFEQQSVQNVKIGVKTERALKSLTFGSCPNIS